jgi:XTP/dITP diphosphohydrolase
VRTWILATHNAGKARELGELLTGVATLLTLADVGLGPDLLADVEVGSTYEENAYLKAVTVHRRVRLPVLADDSGLEVAGLGGAPGVASAHFAGPAARDEDNVARLLAELATHEGDARRAVFRAVLCLVEADGRIRFAEGEVRGRIARAPRGETGFGYDPVFIPDGEEETVAELGPRWKERFSHRARAARALALAMGGFDGAGVSA